MVLGASLQTFFGESSQHLSFLKENLAIETLSDLLLFFPKAYRKRARKKIKDLTREDESVYLTGTIDFYREVVMGRKKRLVARLKDDSGSIELHWINRYDWVPKKYPAANTYSVLGKIDFFNQKAFMLHPLFTSLNDPLFQEGIYPLYPLPKKKNIPVTNDALIAMQKKIIASIGDDLSENLPPDILQKHHLMKRSSMFREIHQPTTWKALGAAKKRYVYEEIFYLQLRFFYLRRFKMEKIKSQVFASNKLLKAYGTKHLPFSLTSGQRKVLNHMLTDLKSGHQMNRLLQGDVGSGKTMVAFLIALIPIADKAQVVLLVPTEILAQQHFDTLSKEAQKLSLKVVLITGSTPAKKRALYRQQIAKGEVHIVIGTHALLHEKISFPNLGLVIVDEQHRFGVVQRAHLWNVVDQACIPHVLVMTATPIPRSLAMTFYSGLDLSIIDTLPPGRIPPKTYHCYDAHRLRLFAFIREKIKEGRQIYMVYPLIEKPKKGDYKYLMAGYESIQRAFPHCTIGILHGRMSSKNKAIEMDRFARGETNIMVSTSVIEVGINVPNATVMVIEDAQKMGLAQIHQHRGRVNRSHHPSFCFLVTPKEISPIAKKRMRLLTQISNGFDLAREDLKIRGGGDLLGIEQSGSFKMKLADLAKDERIIEVCHQAVKRIIQRDPKLCLPISAKFRAHLDYLSASTGSWERVG